MKPLFDSLVRTYVPWLAGVIIGWLISLGIPLDPEVQVQVTLALMGAASMLWYFLARVFEIYVSPKLGWLLGLAKQPIYETPAPVTDSHVAPGRIRPDQLKPSTGEDLDLRANGEVRRIAGLDFTRGEDGSTTVSPASDLVKLSGIYHPGQKLPAPPREISFTGETEDGVARIMTINGDGVVESDGPVTIVAALYSLRGMKVPPPA